MRLGVELVDFVGSEVGGVILESVWRSWYEGYEGFSGSNGVCGSQNVRIVAPIMRV